MKAAGTNFFSSMRDSLADRFLITAGVCLGLLLGSPNQIQAQTTYPVNGVAGFETGLQRIATVNNLVEPTIDWGDGTSSSSPNCLLTAITDTCALTVTTGLTTIDVYGTHRYAAAGQYTITITYGLLGKTVTTTATISPPGNLVILSIGDSVASGEGNPVVRESIQHYPHWALWDDPYSDYAVSPFPADELAEWPKPSSHEMFPCHRSILAGPALAAQQIQSTNAGVTFVHYACSGAKINAGDTERSWAQDASGQLRVARGRLPRIDVLLISAGANSLNDGSDCTLFHSHTFGCGFGALFQYCVFHDCSTDTAFQSDLNSSLSKLPSEYMTLAKEINCINQFGGLPDPSCTDRQKQIPKLVLITEYMDPTHDQNGNYSTGAGCNVSLLSPLRKISAAQWQFFHDFVVHPLNHQFVDDFPSFAQQAGLSVPTYAVTGIEDDFLKHGLCAGSQRWVLTLDDSTDALGSLHAPQELLSGFSGAGHPNSSGHADYQGRIYAALVKYNPPEAIPSATTDGGPYAFGTWTTHNVTLTLSAANAISQSGVGATFYAVDNANCSSADPAGCLTYGGPFMITNSGKHTVTFFSQNAQGYPEAAQSVQVWVDNEPPVMTCKATPSVLWPPNNKMVPVSLNVTAVSAAFGPTPFSLKSVATSAGNAATDIHGFVVGQPNTAGSLRASRPGFAKSGQSYTFVYQSSDELGLTGTCTARVQVPHDQGESNP